METGDLELVRKALESGVRKDLQAAAKSAGIKANGTNVAMTTALKEYMEARADAAPVLEYDASWKETLYWMERQEAAPLPAPRRAELFSERFAGARHTRDSAPNPRVQTLRQGL